MADMGHLKHLLDKVDSAAQACTSIGLAHDPVYWPYRL